jgi:TonB-dependent starch-binding outer membrane protein SusC
MMNLRQTLVPIVLGASGIIAAACGGHTPASTTPSPERTGAVTSATGAQLRGSQSVRLDELLRGRAAGLEVIAQPDGSYRLKIRGNPSNEQEPLVIVDGIEVSPRALDSALAGLNRDDIKQVEVLKDVASTSSYGMRAAGGVILITTKRR